MNATALEQSIFGDMSSLEQSLSDDPNGDKARAMVDYFRSVVDATSRMLGTVKDEQQRDLVSKLLAGFKAAERIILHVWETIHGTVLVI